ncbi:MAG: DNA/RNA non-specific endonuclease [Anaerolineales bacterium]
MQVSVQQLKKASNQVPEQGESASLSFEAAALPEETPLIKAITEGNILGGDVNLEKRKELLSEKSAEPTDFAYERAIGKNDSLYSNFAELIALTKRKVGRVVIIEDGKRTGYATGFMVSNRLLLTNWHVFNNKEMADESEIHFFYEYDAQGHPTSPVIFKLDTTAFFNNQDLDYCFVAVEPMDVTGQVSLESIGYLYLDKTLGKLGDANVEKLNIIHHPLGDYKQISIRENTFAGIEATKIFYETDTAQGSSGSPVFNDQWQVVALHHKSIAKMSADGNDYLDKDGNPISVVDGKIDITRVVWLKNEGIRISVVLNHLLEQNPTNSLVAALAVPPPRENLNFTINAGNIIENKNTENKDVEVKNNATVANDSRENINISVPVAALSAERTIEISLASKIINAGSASKIVTPSTDATNELLLEVAKAEKEQGVDFSLCKGYDPQFLGVEILLPQPGKGIEKQIARLKDNGMELKYFKHSVIFNALTKMPLISAVNVEGDATKRLDNSKRQDDWLRDSRIDIECQLTDKFYSRSNFDKGHMSRFEDANWDDTEKDALRNGVYTCFYTNACPQVVALNRAAGLWGKLEKAVLEKGIKKEAGKQARMTVFNGPIFNEEKDRLFKGVKIPMEYYKIIVWLNDEGKPRATAFKLSQEALVDNIKFDESMRLDQEALDIDKDVVFKNYQCSVKSLGALTSIDFTQLEPYDTFGADNGSQENLIENTESMVL